MSFKYYKIQLTRKQYDHISYGLNRYGYDVRANKKPGEKRLHNSAVKSFNKYQLSSRREEPKKGK